MIRKCIILTLFAAFLLASGHQVNARAIFNINVQVNGTPIEIGSGNIDARPYIEQETNTAYVPIRFVSENLGAKVSWDRVKQQVTITSSQNVVAKLTIGSKTAYVNGEKKTLLSAPVMPNYPNRVMVPLRFVSEVMGAKVDAKKSDDDVLNVNITI